MFDWIHTEKGTFRPVKKLKASDRSFHLQTLSHQTLGTGNIRQAVKLPAGENENDWLAMNVVEFFNQLSCLYAPIADSCTPEKCPEMRAGPKFKYFWQDNQKYKKATLLPARDYITHTFIWAESLINDEIIFPPSPATPFPTDFKDTVTKIFKRLFRIYAHIFYHHRQQVTENQFEAHLNTSFRHFVFFVQEFNLVPPNELEPLKTIIDKII